MGKYASATTTFVGPMVCRDESIFHNWIIKCLFVAVVVSRRRRGCRRHSSRAAFHSSPRYAAFSLIFRSMHIGCFRLSLAHTHTQVETKNGNWLLSAKWFFVRSFSTVIFCSSLHRCTDGEGSERDWENRQLYSSCDAKSTDMLIHFIEREKKIRRFACQVSWANCKYPFRFDGHVFSFTEQFIFLCVRTQSSSKCIIH